MTRVGALARREHPIDPAGAMDSHALSTGRRWTIGVVLSLAILTGFGAVFATWVKRQALDTNNWTDTSTKLLANKEIRTALGAYLVNELFTSNDVAARVAEILPPQAAGLAGPAAAGLRQVAERAAPELLARPGVQDLWRNSNKAAHKQLLLVINGGGPALTTTNGNVVLNLRPLVDQLATNLGVEKQVALARSKLAGGTGAAAQQKLGLPENAGSLTVLKSEDLKSGQDVAKGVKNLSIVLTIISLGLFATAVVLAPGRRRTTLRAVGWSFVVIGIITLLIRRVGGNYVVDNLVQVASAKTAVHEAWIISSSLLYNIAVAMVVYGLVLVLAAWVAGETRYAVTVRRTMAPTFRDNPVAVYAAVTGLYLVILAWGPSPAFRNLIPVLLMAGLVVLGVEIIRRQTAREFPVALSPV